ncbi:MAG TPA: DUF4114 domain-containing protein [Clostridia bacterium]|nr:DUF4114 domain-containing protein [Clostridia bacterium]
MTKQLWGSLCVAGLVASTSFAGTVNSPWAPAAGEKNLHEILGLVPGQENSLQIATDEVWNTSIGGQYTSIIIEFAGSKDINIFGVYDVNAPGSKMAIFNGPDSLLTGSKQLLISGDTLQVGASTLDLNGGSQFGFYIQNGNQTFYSQTSLNGGADQLATYNINDTKFGKPPFPNNTGWILAWEDLAVGSSDRDYNDLVVSLTAQPIPEPTTMIAGALLLVPFAASTIRVLRRKNVA